MGSHGKSVKRPKKKQKHMTMISSARKKDVKVVKRGKVNGTTLGKKRTKPFSSCSARATDPQVVPALSKRKHHHVGCQKKQRSYWVMLMIFSGVLGGE